MYSKTDFHFCELIRLHAQEIILSVIHSEASEILNGNEMRLSFLNMFHFNVAFKHMDFYQNPEYCLGFAVKTLARYFTFAMRFLISCHYFEIDWYFIELNFAVGL
jgi:hypothetical protein